MKSIIWNLFFAFAIIGIQSAKADVSSCPSDAIRPFVGNWQGSAVLTSANGTRTPAISTRLEFDINNCNSFKVIVKYLDSSGNVTRTIFFNADYAFSGETGVFNLNQGTINEGQSTNPMVGKITFPQAGTLVGNYTGAIGGKTAYLAEVMTVTGSQMLRTVKMYAGSKDGVYLGTRVAHESKVE